MAKIYLDATNAEYNINNNNDDVIGLVGTQSVALASGVTGVTVDQNVEEVVFAGAASDYTFLQSGNSIKVYANDTLVSTVFVQGDADGTQLSFSNGTADAILAGGVLTLGGATVDANVATHVNATLDTSNISQNPGVNLTAGQDALTGSTGDDTFTAYIFDNQNTLQSGDRINGGAGTDTLEAEIGNSQNFAMLAKTTSVENMFFQAQTTATDGADNFNTDPTDTPLGDRGAPFSYNGASHDGASQIDAQDLQGVRQLWSDNSRANLVIEDVRENSHTTTIGMRDTDPGNVNYEVYFDPQHITGPGNDAEGATLTIRLADVLDLGKGGDGLSNLPYDGFTLDIGGTAVKLDIDFSALTSYADFKTAIEAALAAKGITSITVTQSPAETAVFSITVTDAGTTYLQGTVGGIYSPIVLTNSGAENLSLTSYTLEPGSQEPSGNLVRTASNNEASEIPSLTQVDVILDNVARGDASGSGDLVIGDMSESGIQQFNVQVDRSSHIDQMASTNNVLEVINVENIGDNGDLIINQIDDVRVFDASTMIGDVSLGAYLSADVTGKYLDLQDIQTDPAADNSEIPYLNVVDTEFSYDLGTGNDTLNLAINASNMAEAGTTTREDFVLEIQGGTGDDDITLSIVDETNDGLALASDDTNWYDNSVLNANLSIDAGAGDDFIFTPGPGNVVIEAGSGNDTVYVDNTGANAAFVFNAVGPTYDVDDLLSDVNNSYRFYKTTLTVNYLGFDVTVDLPNSSGVVSDLQVNQAIKNAINNDDVLNKLLVANDGPANTLVVTSLIDGVMVTADLAISLDTPNTLSAADVQLLNSYYGTPGGTEATHLAIFATQLANFEGNLDYAPTVIADNGTISQYVSDNIITGNTGNDVIVLGTGTNSNDTVVYNGYDQTGNGLNDNDTIVNFDTTWLPAGAPVVTAAPGVQEVVTLTFSASDGSPAAQTIILDGDTINLSAPATQGVIPAADVAFQFAQQFATANWTVLNHVAGTNTVTIQSVAVDNVADLTAASITGTYVEAAATGGGGTVGVAVTTQGHIQSVIGSPTVFTVTFDVAGTAADAAGAFTFDGATVNYAEGDGAITLAAKLDAASFANWTAVQGIGANANVVTFTANANAVSTIGVNADFDLGANVIVGAIAPVAPGVADIGTVTTTIPPAGPGAGIDYLDFSSYGVDSVYVNSDLIFGDVVGDGLLGVNEDYVYMVESATNDGEYTMYLMNTGAVAGFGGLELDVEVGVIGVADFGVEQPFLAENFII